MIWFPKLLIYTPKCDKSCALDRRKKKNFLAPLKNLQIRLLFRIPLWLHLRTTEKTRQKRGPFSAFILLSWWTQSFQIETWLISVIPIYGHLRRSICSTYKYMLVTEQTFGLAELFGQTSTVQFGSNDRTFFCRTQNIFFLYYI